MKKKAILWVGLVFSVMAVLFCVLWAIQSVWLSATPNYPAERVQFNVNVSGSLAILFLVISVFIGFFLYKDRKGNKATFERIQKIKNDALRESKSRMNE